MARHLQHVRSSVVNEGLPKLPTAEQIMVGELAINYAKDHETISLKNTEDEIITFSSDNEIKNLINEKVSDVKNDGVSIVDENKVAILPTATTSGYGVVMVDDTLDVESTNPIQNDAVAKTIENISKVTSAALNDLETRKVNLTDFNELAESVSGKIDDVKIDGISIVIDNVANIPIATDAMYGAVILDTDLDEESENAVQNKVITSALTTIENVTAAALNDLNDRKLDDVTVNGVSIVENKVANIPFANDTDYGLVIVDSELNSGSTNPIQNKVIDETLSEIEKVTSAALNDLEERKANKDDVIGLIPSATTDTYGLVIVDDELDEESTNPVQNKVVSQIIYDNEEIVASALNDLNDKKLEDVTIDGNSIVENKAANIPIASSNAYGVVMVDDTLDVESTNPIANSAVTKVIEENELTISAALNDLNERVEEHATNENIHVTSTEKEMWNTAIGIKILTNESDIWSFPNGTIGYLLRSGNLYFKIDDQNTVFIQQTGIINPTNN